MKRNILLLTALFIFGTLFAQEDSQNAVVSVENDYNPTIVTVNKKSFTPTVESKSQAKPAELIFSKQTTPYTGFVSEKNTKELLPAQERPLPGYLRVGYGIRNDIDAKLAYNLNFGTKSYLRVLGAFDGFKSNINGVSGKWSSRMFNTAVIADFAYKFKKLTFNIDADFNNRVFNYQRASKVDASNNQHHMNYNVDINGVSQLSGPVAYTFNAGYTHSTINYVDGVKNPMTEDHINAGGTITHEVYKDYLRLVGINLDFNGYIYNATLHNAAYSYRNLFAMDFNPFANFNLKSWEIMLGAKLNIRTANGPIFAIAPNITVDKALTKRISFYAGITGGREDNSFRTIERFTPYWGYNSQTDKQIKPTYKIVDVVAGTRLTLEPLSFDIFAGYVLTKDDLMQAYLAPDATTGLVYSNLVQGLTNNAHAGCRIGYDCRGILNIEADAKYDYWTCKNRDYLVLKPEITANAKIEVLPVRNLKIKVGYNFTRYAKGTTERVTDKHDLHARVSYSINKHFGAFIQGDNLLNDRYYEFAGYETKGIRGMLGATVNF